MKIICNDVGLIIHLSDNVVEDVYGNLVSEGSVYLGDLKVYDIESLPDDNKPMKYCYNPDNGFFLNPNYTPTPEEELEKLKDQQALIQQAIDDLIFGGAL